MTRFYEGAQNIVNESNLTDVCHYERLTLQVDAGSLLVGDVSPTAKKQLGLARPLINK